MALNSKPSNGLPTPRPSIPSHAGEVIEDVTPPSTNEPKKEKPTKTEKPARLKKPRKKSKATALIAAVGVGVVGFGVLFVGLNSAQPNMVEVYRTSVPLAANQLVTISDIEVAQVPSGAAPTGLLTAEQLQSNLFFAQVAIPAGTPLSNAIVATETRTNVTLPEGMVTASFETDPASAVAGKLQPGDYINITAVGQGANGEEVARTILHRVLILDVSVNPETLSKSASSKTIDAATLDGPNSPKVYGGVPTLYTVAVSDTQAATLALARDKDLFVTLTSAKEGSTLDVTVSTSEVFGAGPVDAGASITDPQTAGLPAEQAQAPVAPEVNAPSLTVADGS